MNLTKGNQTPILIVGTEAEAKIALDIANELDVLVFGFLTDEPEYVQKEINDILIVAELGQKDSDTLLNDEGVKLVVAARYANDRRDLLGQVEGKKAEIVSLIHPMHHISGHSTIGKGNLAGPGLVVYPNASVGEYNFFGTHVTIGTDSILGEFCTVGDQVSIGNETIIGDEVIIGAGAIIHPGLKIGDQVVIAPGSVVLQDIPSETSVFGNPAKPV